MTISRRLVVGLLCFGAACTSSKKGNEDVLIAGRVFAADKAKPLAGASVQLSDGATVKTDKDGRFRLRATRGDSKVVEVSRDGFAPVSKDAPKGDGYLELYAKESDTKRSIQPEKGGTASVSGGASIKVPENALIDKDGKAPKEATIELAVPDPRKGSDLPALPGNFAAQEKGKSGKVSCESPMFVSAKSEGKDLELGKDSKVEAGFPARRADSNQVGTLFWFDAVKQQWVARGEAKRSRDKATLPSFEAELDRLGWWTVGEFFDKLTCLRACVVDASGKAVPFARGVATGIDHFTQVTEYAGEDGCFALDVRAEAQVSVSVQASAGFVSAVFVETMASERRAEEDATKCQDLGTLRLEAASEDADCPQGLRVCGDACVDVRADSAHCGTCANTCGGAEGRELSCIDGACACPLGFARCEGETQSCSNRRTDPENCGACGEVCGTGARCVGGVCEQDTDLPGPGDTDGGVDVAGVCFTPNSGTAACDACVTQTCGPICTGSCCPLLQCSLDKCDDPESCAIREVCPSEATDAALGPYNDFFACVYDRCRTECGGGGTAGQCASIAPAPELCVPGSPICAGQTISYECDEAGQAVRYTYRAGSGASAGTCEVSCVIDGVTVGSACPYGVSECGGAPIDSVPCDPGCPFPDTIPRPTFGGAPPVDKPGNEGVLVVSCGGDALGEVACDRAGNVCCLRSLGDVYCDDVQCQSGGTESFFCDGAEDCSGQDVCCLVLESTSQRSVCGSNCGLIDTSGTSTQMCHDDLGCTAGTCVRDATLPFFGVCQ